MTLLEFWGNFLSNSLAPILGLIIGIPIAFWVERRLEKRRDKKERDQNNKRIVAILERVLLQITNAELKLRAIDNVDQNARTLFIYFSEIEVVDTMRDELTELETDWDVLVSIDMIISDFRSLNYLLGLNRELFSLKMQDKLSIMSQYSRKFNGELNYMTTISLEGIKDFRIFLFEKYPSLKDCIDGK